MPSLKQSLSCLLLCMLLLSASCSAKAKEFSKDGMHITLTDAFSEGKYYDMTAYYDWEEVCIRDRRTATYLSWKWTIWERPEHSA